MSELKFPMVVYLNDDPVCEIGKWQWDCMRVCHSEENLKKQLNKRMIDGLELEFQKCFNIVREKLDKKSREDKVNELAADPEFKPKE